jgi:DNA-binding CsgD family transcriptional regulator
VGLLLDGYSDANIAALLQLSEETVGTHLRRVYRKLGVHSRLELSARLRS